MIVIADPGGRAVRQLNGLASWYDTVHGRWRHKPIGYLPSDRLRVYDTLNHPSTFLPMHGVDWSSRDVRPALARGNMHVLCGAQERLDESRLAIRLAPALEVARRLNGLSAGPDGGGGLPYPPFGLGPNSNSVFSTFLAALGVAEPRFLAPALFAPGAGRLLLPPREIARARERARSTSQAGA